MTSQRWRGGLRLASRLGVTPEAFWRLSVVEWRALTEGFAPADFARDDLDALMARYPDAETQDG